MLDVAAKGGIDTSGFKSHSITNGFIKFDDADTFSSTLSITSSNISGSLDYLAANITDESTAAFLGADDTNSTINARCPARGYYRITAHFPQPPSIWHKFEKQATAKLR